MSPKSISKGRKIKRKKSAGPMLPRLSGIGLFVALAAVVGLAGPWDEFLAEASQRVLQAFERQIIGCGERAQGGAALVLPEAAVLRKESNSLTLGLSVSSVREMSQTGSGDTEIVSIAQNPSFERTLRSIGLDLLFKWEGRVFALARPEEIKSLQKEAIPFLVESNRFPALRHPELSLQTKINGDYHSYKELEADLKTLQTAYPGLARVYTIGKSLEGRNIYALKVSDNVALDEEETEILFLGCHHAREWISVEVPYLLGKHLVERYATDAEIRSLVNQCEVWIVPLVNPDGLEYSIHYYRYWRKNRRLNGDGSYGVDLNRNYGYLWGFDNEGSSPEPDSPVYRGPAPFSEPETQVIRDFFLSKNFRALVSYHSYSQVILYPWGYTTAPSSQDSLLRQIAARMAELMEPVNGRVYNYGQAGALLYLTNGDTTDWAHGVAGIPAYTIELPPIDQLGGGFFNAEADIQSIFRENLPAALHLLNSENLEWGRTTLNLIKSIKYIKFRGLFWP